MSVETPQGEEVLGSVQNASHEQASLPKKTKRTATIVMGVVVVFFVLLAVASVVTSQRFVCSSCHDQETRVCDQGAHAQASCYECHLNGGLWRFSSQKSREWFVMYPRQWFAHEDVRSATTPCTQIDNDLCLKCHASVGLVAGTGSTGIRIDHSTCVATFTCTTCHVRFAHGNATQRTSQLAMEQCQKCHQKDFRLKRCTRCHEERSADMTASSKAWRATHGSNWRTTHGMGNLKTCSACHTDALCIKCHQTPIPHRQDFGSTHGKTAQQHPESCKTCHREKNFCSACHGIAMPHPNTFLKEHSKLVKQRGDKVCLRCHTQDSCEQCHAQHTHPAGPQTFKQNAQKNAQGGGN